MSKSYFPHMFNGLVEAWKKVECFRGVIVDNEKRLHASEGWNSWQIFHIDECLMMKQKIFFCLNRFAELWINFCQNEIMIVRAQKRSKKTEKQIEILRGFDFLPARFSVVFCFQFTCVCCTQASATHAERFWLLFSICCLRNVRDFWVISTQFLWNVMDFLLPKNSFSFCLHFTSLAIKHCNQNEKVTSNILRIKHFQFWFVLLMTAVGNFS